MELSNNPKYFNFNVNRVEPNLPVFIEQAGRKWISYGADNNYPGFIAALFQKSSMNRTCITSKLDGMIGAGLRTQKPEDNYLLKRANPKESYNDVFEKVALDYITFGGYALNIIFANDGETIAEIYHMDFTKIRSGVHSPDLDRPEFYYYSSDWNQYRKHRPIEYKAFDPNCADTHPSQIFYGYDYEPSNLFYPLPSYAGALNDIQIDVEVSKFHLNNLANQLAPGLFIAMNNGIPDPIQRQEIYDELTMAFRGTENAGKAFISFSDSKENSPEVTPIEAANSDYYIQLEQRISSRILTGHRITSPLLLGLYHNGAGGGFSSNANEIEVSYAHFIATVIRPLQKAMLKTFDTIFYYRGYPEVELYIEQNKLIDAADMGVAKAVE